jgi:hypothetical protein
MSTLQIIPSRKLVTASWVVLGLLGAAIIACAVYAALYGNIAPSDLLVGP